MDDDCEDQGMMPTEFCNAWGCNAPHLVLKGQFWCCPQCGRSYGADAKGEAVTAGHNADG